MKRSGKIKGGNLWVGLIVTMAIAALLYASFRGGGTSIFEPKEHLVVYFENVNGLVRGAPVWLGGMEVGNVRTVQFVNLDDRRRIKAVLTVKESIWEFLTADSKAQLGTIGLLGDKYVEIIPGTKGLPVLESGSELPVLEEVGLDAITAKAPEIAGTIDSLLTNLKHITGRLASGTGTAGRILTDTTLYHKFIATLDRATAVMDNIRKNQDRIMESLATTADNASRITTRLEAGEGTLGRLMVDDSLYRNVAGMARRIDSLLAKIERGDGSAGALVNDEELYIEMKNLIVRVNNLVDDIEKNPRKYFKFSVF